MVKKVLLGMMAFATLLATSCTNEFDPVNNGETATVSFKVETPEIASRAYSDGTTATHLQYAVYAVNGEETTYLEDLVGTKKLEDRKTTVNLELATGKTYQVIFWAAAPAPEGRTSPYTVDFSAKTMTVDYTNAVSNDEARDAFYACETFTVEGANTQNVKLKRPFAQLNIGTNDYTAAENAGFTPTHSTVTVKGVYKTLNLATGVASDKITATFGYAAIPENETFPVENYGYLAMNYFLVGEQSEEKDVVDVEFSYAEDDKGTNNETRTVSTVPVQRNYRTNIFGKLLTSTTDIKVEINKDFDDVENVEIWDGKSISEPAFNETTKTYSISKPNELAWLAAAVSGTLGEARTSIPAKSFAGETFKLENDIDLGGCEWKPIGMGGKHFEGTFDGQGHTIKDFKITKHHGDKMHQAALFCSAAGSAVFKDFIVDNAKVYYPENYTGDYYGAAVIGTVYGTLAFENINVTNSVIQGNNKVAGLIAHDGVSTSINITNCHVSNCTLESKNEEDGGNVGGMVGYLQSSKDVVISNSSVKNCTINAINSADAGKRGNSQFIGAIKGDKTLTIENCVIEGNTFNETGLNTYVSPYDVNFIGGAREAATADVFINGIRYVRSLPESINLDEESIILKSLVANHGVTLSGEGILVLDGVTITAETGSAITLAEGANVTLQIVNNVNLTGATNGIEVAEGRILTVKGTGNLTTIGNAGSGIGVKGANAGSINIEGIAHITAKGNSDHAFGIGGNGAIVVIKNSTVDYACGGHIQPLFVNDTKYGKSEPEGGAGIGGAKIQIEGSIITKVDGGSKAAAIGAQFWQSAEIEIENSTIAEANGGNASAGIGGSRYAGESKYNLSIKIENSTITATGGQGGAGIGSGYDTHCNGHDYEATNYIEIDGTSVINAKGGKYAAGIGTGFHSAYLSGSIAEGATITAASGEKVYKEEYSTAQNIGYGVVDPAREFSGDNRTVTFTVNGTLIECPVQFPVAKVGDKEYKSIKEAIDNWTNNTTLTLLGDVTLTDVVTLKSTEHHILDLGTYTLTAASGKNAFVIKACGTGDAERTAITIKADAANPGGINAGNKCIIYYKYADGGISVNDRPIIKIESGVFTGSTSSLGTAGIYTIGKEARKCATLNISGGTFNCSINGSTKSKLLISGGVFHYSVGSQGDSTALRLISGGKFKTFGFMTADSNNTKFWFGTSMGLSNVGLYIDADNYLVVGGPVITEFGDMFKAKATNPTKWSSYLQYSSADDNGLYYTDAEMAIKKHGVDNVDLP